MSPDGAWVLYWLVPRGGGATARSTKLMRVPFAGGPPELVLEAHISSGNNWFRCPRTRGANCVFSEVDGEHVRFFNFDPERGRGSEVAKAKLTSSFGYCWDLSPDGSRIALSEYFGGIRTIELSTGAMHEVKANGKDNVGNLVWSADGKSLLATLFRVSGTMIARFSLEGASEIVGEAGSTASMAASPDGRWIANTAASTENNAWLLDNF